METIKPIQINTDKEIKYEKLTSAEMGKLWATYMGNSMSIQILSYYLQNVEDTDIENLLKNALNLSKEFLAKITEIFQKESFPLPVGFSSDDVNLGAPRLFEDPFYVHYLKYVAKAGLSIYTIAIPLMYRDDVKSFFQDSMDKTMQLMEQINSILMKKGLIKKPPTIPTPDKATFASEHFLNGYIGDVRSLHALEITHLYDNIENNVTSKALITAFSQVARNKNIRDLFIKGKRMTEKNVDHYIQKLHDENLPSPSLLDDLITKSEFPPFSDKLMLFHKVDMFSMKIRTMGNSLAVNGRSDIALMYVKSLTNIGRFVGEGSKIMMKNNWMEQPPFALDRENIK
ncbi:DUF3231 family protein [Heyndrickxia oleronia]|uniref:DUF3231 family protein n=1 Tax=Heyndrickxia oleronia TaxID=38875 RepID=UPI001C0F1842|nr:DUF3231 family protein [Heyndrickxia oleronia]MBU5211212.1 DUF3231 family protein [Heyndrickxia oleronia]